MEFEILSTIKDKICPYLAFEDILCFREALKYQKFNYSIPVIDKNSRILFLNEINPKTFEAYKKIKTYGSNQAVIDATLSQNIKILKILITNGANIESTYYDGDTSLLIACDVGSEEVVKILLETKANVNVTNKKINPLILSSYHGHVKIVKLLLKFQASLEARDYNDTALTTASRRNHFEIVSLLLKAKADINAVDNEGNTSLMLASKNKCCKIVDLLLNCPN